MKRILIVAGVLFAGALLAFTGKDGKMKSNQIFTVDGDHIFMSTAAEDVVEEQDQKILDTYMVGWTECKSWSKWINCISKRETFPDKIQERRLVQAVIDKYNGPGPDGAAVK